ncbi:hypothetical protein D3C71_921650 [compost metagenome]
MWWHGLAVQDARPLASKGFRPPFGLGRVTFLCVAKEKSPKERPPPPIRPLRGCPRVRGQVGRTAADGTLAFAIHGFGQSPLRTSCFRAKSGRAALTLSRSGPCAGCVCAIIPDGAPDLAPSPRRIGGGTKTVSAITSG